MSAPVSTGPDSLEVQDATAPVPGEGAALVRI